MEYWPKYLLRRENVNFLYNIHGYSLKVAKKEKPIATAGISMIVMGIATNQGSDTQTQIVREAKIITKLQIKVAALPQSNQI